MKSAEIREKFLDFFAKCGHTIIPSSPLLSTDPTVLFTTAGMQQFKDYYLEKPSPYGKRACSCQKCFRTSDIEEVGDNKHLTFLEMLGNFSFGDYFKERAIKYAMEFLVDNLKIKKERLWITVFKGSKSAQMIPKDLDYNPPTIHIPPRGPDESRGGRKGGRSPVNPHPGLPPDIESKRIWLGLGIPKERIFEFGMEDNFWGPTGLEGPCGPTTEIHYDLTLEPCKKGPPTTFQRGKFGQTNYTKSGGGCRPNCECGRFVELWNLVFNEYYQNRKKELSSLKQKGVDTGMGLERLVMVVNQKKSVFETDLFFPIISKIKEMMKIKDIKEPSSFNRLFAPLIAIAQDKEKLNEELKKLKYLHLFRIISDHIKGSIFLASEGIIPSNVEEGYVLRRILRRTIRFGKLLNLPKPNTRAKLSAGPVPHRNEVSGAGNFLIPLAQKVIEIYKDIYPEVKSRETDILTIIQKEEEKFKKTLEKGLKQFEKIAKAPQFRAKKMIPGERVFWLFETYGFPLELTEELAKEKGFGIDKEGFREAFRKHQEISRAGVERKFGGIGKEAGHEATKLHTATHLLHRALREVLGKDVRQMGSDISPQRLRFDFTHPQKMTSGEIKKVENLVNQKIKEDLEVKKEEMPYRGAIKIGALAFFKEKYPEIVIVYLIGDPSDPSGQVFSKEICAGPHVNRTSELGHFKIIKEESSGAGIRRIRAILLPASQRGSGRLGISP